ncbi:hypothetical protein FS320_40105 [Microvirga tunisiensis]|uniref:Double-GTPase 1 domain-containing protein n=1 Tax=Microvirga tunisiensis TaxID=2108360 RepID=A0A5N7MY23_9HYPH|nr:hypothetical protein [Microvirga tunisiensis]MPR30964.1 hypothetical protein [Microvirga tunisiensis]
MMGGRTVLLVGGPEVGKTNYLMRFWLAVRDNKERSIKPLGLPDDLEYLNRGADALLGGHFAGRTLQRIGALCEIPLTVRDEPFSLLVPDIAGEEWMRIYNDRRWPADWATYFTKDTSFLVFVRAHSPLNVPQLDWQTVQRYFGGNRANLDPNISKDVTPEEAPTQVVIVD